jgi:hypothetical protein
MFIFTLLAVIAVLIFEARPLRKTLSAVQNAEER